MVPIIANIVARQENPTARKSFALSASYGLGIACVYGLLGAVIAKLGASIGLLGMLQNPMVLITFAIIFVALGCYMLELFSIRLPQFISQPLARMSQSGDKYLGSTLGSFIAGFLSALVVSPCVSAPLSGALLAVSAVGDMSLGFFALFALGLGLSTPLVIFTTTGGNLLPKAGAWMHNVKQKFAFMMFAVAIIMIERIFTDSLSWIGYSLWALWMLALAILLWKLANSIKTQLVKIIIRLIAISVLFGVFFYGYKALESIQSQEKTEIKQSAENVDDQIFKNNRFTNQDDVNTDINNALADHKQAITITTLAELDELLAVNNRVIVDVTAEWCVQCRIMEQELFTDKPEDMKAWQLIKADITETTDDSNAILQRYDLVGPPALIYYNNGQLLIKQVGEIPRDDFVQVLKELETHINNLNTK